MEGTCIIIIRVIKLHSDNYIILRAKKGDRTNGHDCRMIPPKCSVFVGQVLTQTLCNNCKEWSTPNQPQPLVGVTISCPEVGSATLLTQLNFERSPKEVQTGQNGWDWWYENCHHAHMNRIHFASIINLKSLNTVNALMMEA